MISEATKARFAREVAKYPADQKQSAVMACLPSFSRSRGYVSEASEAVIADYLGMPQIAVHEVTTFYNMYNQHPVGKYKLNVCTNLPCCCAMAARHWSIWSTSWAFRWARPRRTACSPLQQCECLGACADAPVMLVNDRHMCSFMGNDKLDQLVDSLRAAEGKQ